MSLADTIIIVVELILQPGLCLAVVVIAALLYRSTRMGEFFLITLGFAFLLIEPLSYWFGLPTVAPTIRIMEWFSILRSVAPALGFFLILIGLSSLLVKRRVGDSSAQ